MDIRSRANARTGYLFTLTVGYGKWLYDPASESAEIATTWEASFHGTFGTDDTAIGESYVVLSATERIDKFIAAYLRVNETACGPR